MKQLILLVTTILSFNFNSFGQLRGEILFAGDGSMDPNGDGFVSETNAGFSIDGYYVDEFELKMFGIPFAGDGELSGDIGGQSCSVTDLAADTIGHSAYGLLEGDNLIFRFRLAGNRPSVEAYTILIDTDNRIGPEDPNATADNPGFEVDITLIKNASKGVYVYNIDGIESCPTPEAAYPYATHFQSSVAGTTSCDDADYFYDFYIPFEILNTLYGITPQSELRFVALTNVSATCAMAGKISDIGGVNDEEYTNATDAFLALSEEQCPTALEDLCQTCEGFKVGTTEKPEINQPVKVGESAISGTAEATADIFLSVFNETGLLVEDINTIADANGNWDVVLSNPLTNEDSITARAQIEGACSSGLSESDVSYAVVNINDPPVISGTADDLSYTENADPIPIFGDLNITDSDDTEMDSAWVTVTANYVASEDVITLPSGQGLNLSWEASLNRARIYGKAPLSTYQAVIQGVTYSNSSEDPDEIARTFTVQVHDGLDGSNILSRNLMPVKVNDAPVISGTTTAIGYDETDTEVVIDNAISISDVDNTTMAGATVSIILEYDPVEDVLLFTNQNGITGTFDGGTGVLTLTGVASIADYETALSSVRYENVHAGNDPIETISDQTRVIRFQVNDGAANSNMTQRSIDMLASPNIAPVFVDNLTDKNPVDTVWMVMDEDTVLDSCLAAYDTDGDQVNLTFNGLENGEGNVSLESNSLCFTFTPSEDYNGEEFIRFTGCDDAVDKLCDDVVVGITINPVNDVPEIVDGSNNPIDTIQYSATEDTPANFCLDVIDKELDPVEFSEATSLSGNSSLNIPDANVLCFDFSPDPDYFGYDTLQLVVCETGSTVQCDTVIAIVEIVSVNDPPVIQDAPQDTLFFDALEDIITEMCVTVIDPDGDFVEVTEANHIEGNGIFEPDPPGDLCFYFQSAPDSTGMVYAEIVVCDDGTPVLCDTIIAVVNIIPVNDIPVIRDETNKPLTEFDSLFFTLDEDESINVCLTATDADGDDLEISLAAEVEGGGTYDVYDAANLCFSFTPEAQFNGRAIGEVTICESANDTVCVSAIVVFDINPVNDPPVIGGDGAPDTLFFETEEDVPVNLCLNATDPDGDTIEITEIISNNPNGTFDPGDGTDLCILYTPDDDFNGEVIGEVVICDDQSPALCDTVIVVVDVDPVNDPPDIEDENGVPLLETDTLYLQVLEDQSLNVCINATDPDGDPIELTNASSMGGNGTYTITDPNGLCFTYVPDPDFFGQDEGELTVCESTVDPLCASTVVVIDVIPVNDPPVITESGNETDTIYYTVDEDVPTSFCLQAVDADDDIISITEISTESQNATFSYGQSDLCFLFTPALNFYGVVSAEIVVCDDQDPALCDTVVVIVDVLPVNDPPEFISDNISLDTMRIITDEDIPVVFCFLVVDPDSDDLTDPVIQSETNLGDYLDAASDQECYSFNPYENVNGTEYALISVCDEFGLCSEIVLEIVINPVNDAPVAVGDYYESNIYYPFAGDLTENDYDIENHALIVGIIDDSELHGTLELNPNGTFKYTPSRKFVGTERFEYILCDNGEGPACSSAEVIFVLSDPLVIWQAVSPNGDNMNDNWVIEGIDLFPDNHIKIFDRYNNLVYEANRYNNQDVAWFGQSNRGLFSTDVPEGTYFYMIDLGYGEAGEGTPLSGFIILKKN